MGQGCHQNNQQRLAGSHMEKKILNFDWMFSVRYGLTTLYCAECMKTLYVCIHRIIFLHFYWQFIIFN
jgi:hypothetical protein